MAWPDGRGRRRLALALLIAAVAGLHAVATREIGALASRSAADAMPPRVQVAYVRTVEPEAPPAVALRAAAPQATRPSARPRAPREPAAAVSAPVRVDGSADTALRDAAAQAMPDGDVASVASSAAAAASAPASDPGATAASAVADAGPAASDARPTDASPATASRFVWPPSTRVSYTLTGWYRGDVSGRAQVEWVRLDDGRYQVHLDVVAGPEFAPLLSRRMTSDGRIVEGGLAPDRYDEDTEVLFRSTRHARLKFEPQEVVLADGRRLPRPDGVQDTASQFVQLAYLFTTEPERLRAGASVDIPLALPRSVDTWSYDVAERQSLSTPFGAIDAFHLKPRRTSRPNGELTIEMWIAPELRYLPVRIRIRQSQENWADLTIDRKPEMAEDPQRP